MAAFFSRLARLSAEQAGVFQRRRGQAAAAPDADAGERFPPAAEAQLDEVAADHLGARRGMAQLIHALREVGAELV